MLGKIFGAVIGDKVAGRFSRVGGGTGALLGAGLMSRRFRGLALAGLAAAGAGAAYKAYKLRKAGADPQPAYPPRGAL